MSLTQLSAGIVAGVFSLTTIGSELMMGTDKMAAAKVADKAKEESPAAGRADSASYKARRDAKQSPWQNRPMIPSGPKF